MALNSENDLGLKIISEMIVVKWWNRLLWEVVEYPSLEISKTQLHKAMANLLEGRLVPENTRGPFQPKLFSYYMM